MSDRTAEACERLFDLMKNTPQDEKPATVDPYTPGWEQFYEAWIVCNIGLDEE